MPLITQVWFSSLLKLYNIFCSIQKTENKKIQLSTVAWKKSDDMESNLSLMTSLHDDTMMTPAVVAMMAWMEDTSLRKRQTHEKKQTERMMVTRDWSNTFMNMCKSLKRATAWNMITRVLQKKAQQKILLPAAQQYKVYNSP